MEALTTLSVPSSSIPRKTTVGITGKTVFLQGQVIKSRSPKRSLNHNATKIKFLSIRSQASGSSQKEIVKDESIAFVAGATGKVGSRAVRELLKLGFQVRAGVRSAEKAQSLVQSVKQMGNIGKTQPVEKLEIVQCDLEKKDQIVPALGNATVVLCCIGASEKEIFDITGPYRIDYVATKNLIEAASSAKVDHFILLTSLGTNKIGFPAAILNLFWGVLIWKRKAEEALLASGLPYTIVRPGGMERPTDSFKETHNLTLSKEDTLFGGLVSNLQVAELMACMAKNRELSFCKIVEVVAETTAPLTPIEELLKTIPSQRPYDFKPKQIDQELIEEKEPDDKKPEETATRPLSPYTAYEDLKPPTSPSPTPSTTPTASTPTPLPEEVKKSETLSPYTAYEDLKPPSSPSPTPSGVKKQPPDSADVIGSDAVSENGPPQPEPENDTLKHTPDETVEKETHVKPKPRPLSPYFMYEDLKPPSSPTPSTPVSN